MARATQDPSVQFLGIDSSEPMLTRCRNRLEAQNLLERVDLRCGDISETALPQASFVVLHYTLQFISPELREDLLRRIHEALLPGGALLLTEKVICQECKLDELFVKLYYDMKRRNGYSELEIAQKRRALEDVLVPLTLDENVSLLEKAGFERVEIHSKWLNFTSLLAVK